MEKMSIALALGLLSMNAFASSLPQDNLSAYQEAVNIALNQKPLDCIFNPHDGAFYANSLGDTIKKTTSVEVNDTGAQPVLVFFYNTPVTQCSFSVTTTSDYKSIISVDFVQQDCSMQEVNLGTIENPRIVQQPTCQTTVTASCK